MSWIDDCCRSSPSRQATSREIARVKRATGYPTRDYARERDVILGARSSAEEIGVSPDVAETVIRLLIRSSLTTQEQASVAAHGARQRPPRAGDRRRRQDGRLVRAVPELAGLRGRGRGSEGRAGRRCGHRRLARVAVDARLHRGGRAAGRDQHHPAAARAAPAARRGVRSRFAEVAAARRARQRCAPPASRSPRSIRCSDPTPNCCRAGT